MILLKYPFHNNGVANWHKDCPTKSRKTEACLQWMCSYFNRKEATRCRCPVLILKIFTSVFQSISSVALQTEATRWGHKTAETASDSRAPPPDPLSRVGNPFYYLHSTNLQLSGFFKTTPHVETDDGVWTATKNRVNQNPLWGSLLTEMSLVSSN